MDHPRFFIASTNIPATSRACWDASLRYYMRFSCIIEGEGVFADYGKISLFRINCLVEMLKMLIIKRIFVKFEIVVPDKGHFTA